MTEQELILGNYQMLGWVLIIVFSCLVIYILGAMFFIIKDYWRALK